MQMCSLVDEVAGGIGEVLVEQHLVFLCVYVGVRMLTVQHMPTFSAKLFVYAYFLSKTVYCSTASSPCPRRRSDQKLPFEPLFLLRGIGGVGLAAEKRRWL